MWKKCPDLRGVCISWVEMYIKMVLGEENGVLIWRGILILWVSVYRVPLYSLLTTP